jgi:hypothetical protein
MVAAPNILPTTAMIPKEILHPNLVIRRMVKEEKPTPT